MVDVDRLNLSAERLGGLGRPFAWYLASCAVTVTIATCTWMFAMGGSDEVCGAFRWLLSPAEAHPSQNTPAGDRSPIAGTPVVQGAS